MKEIRYGNDARKALFAGMTAVNKSTSCTLGPKGRNASLARGWGGPTTTNDGKSIARDIKLKDPFQDMGADFIKAVAEKIDDGTTTSILMTHAISGEGLDRIDVGLNVIGIKNGILKASKSIVDYLKSIAKPISTDEEIKQVATVSSESEEIGNVICNIIKDLGHEGTITVEDGQTTGIVSEVTQGMDFDRGFVSPYMITNPEKMEAECVNPLVLVTDKKVTSTQEMLPILEAVMSSGRKELVIIADDISGDALHTFVVNKLRGNFSVLAVKSPGFGERKKDYLQDIATVTGATFISSDTGKTLDKVIIEELGSCSRVVSTKDKTVIVGGVGDKVEIDGRIASARQELAKTESKHDKLKIEERIAKLSGGVAVIKVGAASETEMKYLKDKVEDAVAATKMAIEEGILPGGGVALLRAYQSAIMPGGLTRDEQVGFNIVLKALKAPLGQISINCGVDPDLSKCGRLKRIYYWFRRFVVPTVVDRVSDMKLYGGYDALNDRYVDDMVVAGIVDPLKVTRSVVENAASAAGTFLTTEVAVVEVKEEKKLD